MFIDLKVKYHVELDGVEQDVESFEEQQIDRYWIKKYFFVEVPVNIW
jgi:hypothetical protein